MDCLTSAFSAAFLTPVICFSRYPQFVSSENRPHGPLVLLAPGLQRFSCPETVFFLNGSEWTIAHSSNRRTLVTGGAGFIGSHLTERLLASGRHVTVIDDLSTSARRNLDAVATHDRLTLHVGTMDDDALLESVLGQVDEVYHLAAAVGVALIARDPIASIHANINPTQKLLAHAQRVHADGRPIRCFLASSSEVYGKNSKTVWNEDDDIVLGSTSCARWSYGATKAIDEFLALAYWQQFQLPVVVGRFFNVVGPRQTGSYGMVLPRMIRAAVAGEPVVVHDDGRQQRCFAHVSDVVSAIEGLMVPPSCVGRVFNIGSARPVSIVQLAEMVISLADSQSEIVYQTYEEAYGPDFEDTRRRVPDLSRLEAEVQCAPRIGLEGIITELLEIERNSSRLLDGRHGDS